MTVPKKEVKFKELEDENEDNVPIISQNTYRDIEFVASENIKNLENNVTREKKKIVKKQKTISTNDIQVFFQACFKGNRNVV